MRIVIQRVKESSVMIDGHQHTCIGPGMLVLLGIENTDQEEDACWLVKKILQLRIFPDENKIMNRSVQDIGAEILVVSQFTLHALTKKGNRPSYIRAARPETAIPLYELFIKQLKENYSSQKVFSGVFGAMMEIRLINDGPVTIIIDSRERDF